MNCTRNCLYMKNGECGLKLFSSDATDRCPLMPDGVPETVPYKPPMTNADHIRSMTDEELAEYLYDRVGIAAEHIAYCKNNPECELILESDICIPGAMCKECLRRWLKQPYKEE